MPTYTLVTGITLQQQLMSLPSRYLSGDPYCETAADNCCDAPTDPIPHGGGPADPPPASNACCNNISLPSTLYATTSGGTGNAAQFDGITVPLPWSTGGFVGVGGWTSGSLTINGNYILITMACIGPDEYVVTFTGGLCAVSVNVVPTTCSPFLLETTLTLVTFPDCSGTLDLLISE